MIFLNLFLTFFKIGAFTFGGGYAMLPLVQAEVIKNGWLESEKIINFIAVSESTPGPFAINISTYVGMEMGGFIGAVCATLGVVLPSFIIILIIARLFEKFKNNKFVDAVMNGLKPAVVGLIGTAVLSIGKTVFFKDGFTLSVLSKTEFCLSLFTFALMMFLSLKKKHPILIICLSAIIGIIGGYVFNF